MKSTYKNALRSKQLIKDAIFVLLQTKELSQISICNIVKQANINRGTFYNHYSCVQDVLEEFKSELMAKLATDLKLSYANNNSSYFINATLEHVKQNEQNYKELVKALPRSVFYDMKMELIRQIKLLPEDLPEEKIYFLINGFTGFVLDYLEERTPLSLHQIASETLNYINNWK